MKHDPPKDEEAFAVLTKPSEEHPGKLCAYIAQIMEVAADGAERVEFRAETLVDSQDEAREWFERMLDERPWETRQ